MRVGSKGSDSLSAIESMRAGSEGSALGCCIVSGLRVLEPGWRGVAVPWLCCCGLWMGWTLGSWTMGGFVCFSVGCGCVVIFLFRVFVWVGTEIYLVQAGRGFITVW